LRHLCSVEELSDPTLRFWNAARADVPCRRAPNALIPLSSGGQAFERAALSLGMPDLGVRVGERTQTSDYALIVGSS
jgi:hypothetical protein